MTVYLAINGLAGWDYLSPSAYFDTTSGRFDPNYTNGAVQFNTATGGDDNIDMVGARLIDTSGTQISLTSAWLHYAIYVWPGDGARPGSIVWQFQNSSGTPVLQCLCTIEGNPNTYKVQFWNGAAWVDTGIVFTILLGQYLEYDFQIVCGASGSVIMYTNNAPIATGVISSSACNNLSYLRMGPGGHAGKYGNAYSQVLVKDSVTLLRKVARRTINVGGFYSQWQGAVANISDNNDTTWIADNGNGDRNSYTLNALTITPDSTKAIEAVVVSARLSKDSTGVQNANAFVRESSIDYDGSNLPLQYNLSGKTTIWLQDPATASRWANAAANSTGLEIGIRAST